MLKIEAEDWEGLKYFINKAVIPKRVQYGVQEKQKVNETKLQKAEG